MDKEQEIYEDGLDMVYGNPNKKDLQDMILENLQHSCKERFTDMYMYVDSKGYQTMTEIDLEQMHIIIDNMVEIAYKRGDFEGYKRGQKDVIPHSIDSNGHCNLGCC